jgi:hypothetical protein
MLAYMGAFERAESPTRLRRTDLSGHASKQSTETATGENRSRRRRRSEHFEVGLHSGSAGLFAQVLQMSPDQVYVGRSRVQFEIWSHVLAGPGGIAFGLQNPAETYSSRRRLCCGSSLRASLTPGQGAIEVLQLV